MSNSAARGCSRVITGLLVLVVLLVSAAQGHAATLAQVDQRDHQTLSQTVGSAIQNAALPHHDDNCDHGFACCLASSCAMHSVWLCVSVNRLLDRSGLTAVYAPGLSHWSAGIATLPASPPPRSAV